MTKPPQTYRSFLIRCWWSDNAGNPVWRVVLEEPGQTTALHFAAVAELCTFLLTTFATTDTATLPENPTAANDDPCTR